MFNNSLLLLLISLSRYSACCSGISMISPTTHRLFKYTALSSFGIEMVEQTFRQSDALETCRA